MKFVWYVKDCFAKVLLYAILVGLVLAVLIVFGVSNVAVMCVAGLMTVFGVTLFLYDYLRKRSFYEAIRKILPKLDKKYLLIEMLPKSGFLEGRILREVLYDTDKAMAEEIGEYRRSVTGFREYIELWVHEVKTPLSVLSLTMRKEDRKKKIYLGEIENYIDQALYYSKIDTIERDYVMKKVRLEDIVNSVIRKNKDSLIENEIKVETNGLGRSVHSDAKWLEFILNQILLNAIKYRKRESKIEICAESNDKEIRLTVRDNGIGIRKSELRRVFEKGFTGSNDRKTRASTGMGLYIANELARDLGHRIEIDSMEGEWTRATIVFGDDEYVKVVSE